VLRLEGEVVRHRHRLLGAIGERPRELQRLAQLDTTRVDVEDQLQYARRFYNGSVRDYNTSIQRVPDMFVARSFGFTENEYFQADEDDRRGVRVTLAS